MPIGPRVLEDRRNVIGGGAGMVLGLRKQSQDTWGLEDFLKANSGGLAKSFYHLVLFLLGPSWHTSGYYSSFATVWNELLARSCTA